MGYYYYVAHADKEFGIPEQKKFPLDSRDHVISAIKFFNYADPKYEKALASRIIRKIHEYNITGLSPSEQNRFYHYYHPDEVSHSGIVGMHWGQRNGPPYPLSTASHNSVTKGASSEARLAAVTRGGGKAASLHTANSGKQNQKLSTVKDIVGSKAGVKTAGKYLRTYLLNKNEVDTTLKKSTDLKRIQSNKDFENFAYYATYKKSDVNKYAGLFGDNLKRRSRAEAKASGAEDLIKKAENMKIYQLSIKNTKDIKIPSDESCGKITAKLLKDDTFRSELSTSIASAKSQMKRPGQQLLFADAQRAMKKDPSGLSQNERTNVYKALNLTLTFHDENNLKVQDKFYGEMKKHGYGALVDVNDQQYSSYHAKRPMIVFDTSASHLDSVKELSDRDIQTLYKRANTERLLREVGEQTVGTAYRAIRHGDEEMGEYWIATDPTSEFIEHHGILGMHWGARNGPPYPLSSAEHASVVKKASKEERAAAKDRANGGTQSKKIKGGVKTASKQAHEETPEEHEAAKKKAIESGSAQDVMKFKSELTNAEKQQAIQRLNLDQQLENLSNNERNRAKQRTEELIKEADAKRAKNNENLIKYGSAKDIYANRKNLSVNEMQTALNRMNNEKKLANAANGQSKLDKVLGAVEKTTKTVNTVRNAVDAFKNLNKSLSGEGGLSENEKAIRSGDPKQVLKRRGQLSPSDWENATKVINNLQKIQEAALEEQTRKNENSVESSKKKKNSK